MPSARAGHRRRRLAKAGAGLLALALLGAACGDDSSSNTSTGAGGSSGGMSISIVEPKDGATVGKPFEVKVDSNTKFGKPDTGLHHVHIYYDGRSTNTADYDIIYGNETDVSRDLSPGKHTIEAVIANPDHSTTDASAKITVNVSASAGGGGNDNTTSSSEYGY